MTAALLLGSQLLPYSAHAVPVDAPTADIAVDQSSHQSTQAREGADGAQQVKAARVDSSKVSVTGASGGDSSGVAGLVPAEQSVSGKARGKHARVKSQGKVEKPQAALDDDEGGKGRPGGPLSQERAREDARKKLRKTWKVAKNTYPTLVKNDTAKAMRGYAVVPVEGGGYIHLMDPQGKIIKTWPYDVDRVRLLPNCHLLVIHASGWGLKQAHWLARANYVTEYDWDGKIAWEYRSKERTHHDVQRLPNGNTSFLAKEKVASKNFGGLGTKAGFPEWYESSEMIEVDPVGKIVWRWSAAKHFDASDCGMRKCQSRIDFTPKSKLFEWTHANTASVIPPNKWYDAGDQRFKPGNRIFMPRNFWKFSLVDRDTGDIVWSFDGQQYGGIGPAHDPHMIAADLPGAGNILFFSNSSKSREEQSQVWEVNPTTGELVWKYEDGDNLFSSRSGTVSRLPNGNTLISVDKAGRAIEVTPQGEVVWEINSQQEFNRVYKYPVGYCRYLK